MRIRFDRGTLVLEPESSEEDPSQFPGATWDERSRAWRVPAERHDEVLVRMADVGVRPADNVTPERLGNEWSLPELRWYQQAAIQRWETAGRRGVIALPTGSGKTLVALAAIARVGAAALCLVPTRVLLDQWATALAACWPHPIGRLGDGDYQVAPITVATYASATTWAPRIGDRFGLVVVDEAHHVGAWCPSEIFEMLAAPARLGLTATPPPPGGALGARIGPVVYSLPVDALTGSALSDFDLVTVPVELERAERDRYHILRSRFATVYAGLARALPGLSWSEFVRSASKSVDGRRALEAWRSYRSLLAYPEGKRAALHELLQRHAGARTLVFTPDNTTAYAIARELLVVPITHEIIRSERTLMLDRFKTGEISVLVSSQVLDEGFDIPDADVAIIVGGSASSRRHVQRVGRVLRPRPDKRAVVYELEVQETTEAGYVQRRRAGLTHAEPAMGGAP
ncbi:MAG: DEAD/DEAH box helicase family protein [Kofleriaceae bacterium]